MRTLLLCFEKQAFKLIQLINLEPEGLVPCPASDHNRIITLLFNRKHSAPRSDLTTRSYCRLQADGRLGRLQTDLNE